MKNVAKVFIAVGLGILFLGGMLDADGIIYLRHKWSEHHYWRRPEKGNDQVP